MSKKTYTFSKNGPGNLRTIARNGQSIRTDRIDFAVLADGTVNVTQMTRYKSNRKDVPHTWTTYDPEVGFDISLALAWCNDNGFVVETWPQWGNSPIRGARAWRDERWAIRTAHQIGRMRRQLENDTARWVDTAPWKREELGLVEPIWTMLELRTVDLAFVG